MQTASFSGLIKNIFYIIIFYYVFKFLARLFLPLLVKKVVNKASENFQKQQQNYQDASWKKSPNDDVIYKTDTSDKPRETKKIGEYIDYEEIE